MGKRETALVAQDSMQGNALIAPKDWLETVDPSAYLTTLDMSNETNKLIVFKALQDAPSVWFMNGVVVNAVHVIVSSGEKDNLETGETGPCIVTTLIDSDGLAYRSTSMSFYRAIMRVFAIYRRGPWQPPLKLRMMRKQSGTSGREYQTLDIVTE
jgi:hypothetical protein